MTESKRDGVQLENGEINYLELNNVLNAIGTDEYYALGRAANNNILFANQLVSRELKKVLKPETIEELKRAGVLNEKNAFPNLRVRVAVSTHYNETLDGLR